MRRDPLDGKTQHREQASGAQSLSSSPTLVASEPRSMQSRDRVRPTIDGQRYEALGVLGVGGMGEVSLARDLRIGREVAFKCMHPDLAQAAEYRSRFVREARVQGQLDHPAVVPVYDLGVARDGSPFFTMRRVSGQSLDKIIEALAAGDEAVAKEYSLRRRLAVFQQICQGVAYAHARASCIAI